MDSYEQLLDDILSTPAEVETEQEQEHAPFRKASYKVLPKVQASKANCKEWNMKGNPPVASAIIMFSREAPYIELLNEKVATIGNEFKGVGGLTNTINIAYCKAVEIIYSEMLQAKGYLAAFERGEDIPEEWLNIILRDKATQAKLQQKQFDDDLHNLWLPEFRRLGIEKFAQTYGQHPDYADIIEYCQKSAPLVTMVSQTEEGLNLTSRIKNYLTDWAKEQNMVTYKEVEEVLVNEAILPDPSDIDEFRKAKGVLKGIGTSLGLSKREHKGFWNIGLLNCAS